MPLVLCYSLFGDSVRYRNQGCAPGCTAHAHVNPTPQSRRRIPPSLAQLPHARWSPSPSPPPHAQPTLRPPSPVLRPASARCLRLSAPSPRSGHLLGSTCLLLHVCHGLQTLKAGSGAIAASPSFCAASRGVTLVNRLKSSVMRTMVTQYFFSPVFVCLLFR